MNERPILHVVRKLGPKAEELRDVSPAFRVATEAYVMATDLGASGDLLEGLWSIVEREAKAAEGRG